MMRRALQTVAMACVAVLLIVVCAVAFFLGRPDLLCRLIGDTAFSAEYTESAFWDVEPGMTRDQVAALLGNPVSVQRGYRILIYCPQDAGELRFALACSSDFVEPTASEPLCASVQSVASIRTTPGPMVPGANGPRSLWTGPFAELRGHSEREIRAALGPPLRVENDWPVLEVWNYSYSPTSTHYIRRAVSFDRRTGRVNGLCFEPHWD